MFIFAKKPIEVRWICCYRSEKGGKCCELYTSLLLFALKFWHFIMFSIKNHYMLFRNRAMTRDIALLWNHNVTMTTVIALFWYHNDAMTPDITYLWNQNDVLTRDIAYFWNQNDVMTRDIINFGLDFDAFFRKYWLYLWNSDTFLKK